MKDVLLYTRDGQFAHRGQSLAYQKWPEVMVWGERMFAFKEMSHDEPSVPVYYEVFVGFVDLKR